VLSRFVRNEFNLESRSTIGVEFATRVITIDDKRIKAQIWDTGAHHPCFLQSSLFSPIQFPSGAVPISCHHRGVRPLLSLLPLFVCLSSFGMGKGGGRCNHSQAETCSLYRYYRGALGALLMYDVTKPSSFSNLKTWVEELREHASPHIVVILIGNKTDLDALRLVPAEVAETFAGAFLTPPPHHPPPPPPPSPPGPPPPTSPLPFAIRTRNGAAEIVRRLPFGGHLFVQRKTA